MNHIRLTFLGIAIAAPVALGLQATVLPATNFIGGLVLGALCGFTVTTLLLHFFGD